MVHLFNLILTLFDDMNKRVVKKYEKHCIEVKVIINGIYSNRQKECNWTIAAKEDCEIYLQLIKLLIMCKFYHL